MEAHTHDLRAEVGTESAEKIKTDWRRAGLDPAGEALLAFAEKLTLRPSEMSPGDLELLRAQGFSDTAIHDAVQVISYFNYINRVADGLGVDLEEGMPEKK